MKDNAEVAGFAFYDSDSQLKLFSSKILRENWAKEDHDAIKTIDLAQGERLVGVFANHIPTGQENEGLFFNLQFVISK